MRILLASLAGVLLLSVALFVSREPQKEPSRLVEKNNSASNLSYDLDSDSDSLKDWEETLWGTDPKNPDTDGDGVEDGEQVESARLARVAAGELPETSSPKRIVDYTSGIDTQSWNLGELVAQVLPRPDTQTPVDPQKISYKTYGNEAATVINSFLKLNTSEVDTFEAAIKEKVAPEYFDELKAIAERYKTVGQNLSLTTVPKEMQLLATTLRAAYATQATEIEKLTSYKQQGSIPASAFSPYSQSVIATGRALLSFAQFLSAEGIVFGSDEPGAIWALPR